MPDQMELLKRLQYLDSQLFQLRKQQRAKPLELQRAQAKVDAQAGRVKESDARLKTLQLAQKEKETELQSKEESVKKLQGQLFQLKTNKEYAAMQREIGSLKADNSLLEEEILKRFDAIEQSSKARQAEQQILAKEEEQLRIERARIDGELQELTERVTLLEKERGGVTPQVPAPVLAVYERTLMSREGLALVPVVNDACGGCHRRLPPQVINQAILNTQLTTCEMCNRILYFDEDRSQL